MLVMIMAVVIGPIPTLPVSAAGMAFVVVGATLVASAGALVSYTAISRRAAEAVLQVTPRESSILPRISCILFTSIK